MREEIIAKGAELGIWNAEEMSAEVAKSEQKGMMPFSGSALLLASRFGPEETFSGGAKSTMSWIGLFLEGLFVGRLTRGMVTKTQLAEKDVSIHRLETLVEAMEYDKHEAIQEASKKTKRQMYSTNGGVINVQHPTMGGSTMNAHPESTTSAFGQSPIAMRRAENVFF